jgi:predicted Zn-dependent protease with MMP-like domain
VVVCVETRPTLEQLKSVGLGKGDEILGLYEGIALTEKDVNDPEVRMPDRVWVFQEPIERMCRNRKEMVLEIQDTVIHEIGHHFGLDEDELEAIEDEYD